MDQNDPQGENLETPAVSQTETTTADEGDLVNQDGANEPSPEEVAFDSLSGSTQQRVRTLAWKANQATELQTEVEQLRRDMEALRLRNMTPPEPVNPDVKDAVSKLDNFGIATKDFVKREVEEGVNQQVSGLVWKMEMDRLESRHSGGDGLPSFDRNEYTAFVNANPQYRNYQPEDVYEKMFSDEILDAKLKGAGKPAAKQGPSIRGTRTRVQEETMTPEYIESRLAKPDGRAWYEQNRERINVIVANQIPSAE